MRGYGGHERGIELKVCSRFENVISTLDNNAQVPFAQGHFSQSR